MGQVNLFSHLRPRSCGVVLRPVVIGSGSEALGLYVYKSENTGNAWSGSLKEWITQTHDPYTYSGDIEQPIGNQKWELGVNMYVSAWYDYCRWYTGTFGYVGNQVITSHGSSAVSITIQGIDKDEATLGTINTTTFNVSDEMVVTIQSLAITNHLDDQNIVGASSGSWSGSLNGFLRTTSWSCSVDTDGTAPTDPGSSTASPYVRFGPIIGN